ncbi:MAG TPA: ATP-binding protein [Mycobacteriales bacterium]|nr:ATP-binding protein [Mycobacteriales bacterium]
MAGRQIKQLVRAHRDGDDLAFRRAAQEIIEEEEARQHLALARDLRQLLVGGSGTSVDADSPPLASPPRDADSGIPLLDVRVPDRPLTELSLSGATEAAIAGLAREVHSWPVLDDAGIPRRQRVLFTGPPGCGKTSAAEGIAAEIGLPLAVMRVDAVVSSYLGETSSNLRRVFEYSERVPVVLLFDEFDALGKERADPTDHGELRRVVSAVLQLIERYRGPSLLIAATNHADVLDSALWRRFDEVVAFPLPTVAQLKAVLRGVLRDVRGLNLDRAASALKGQPHAAAEKAAFDALRIAILAGRIRPTSDDVWTAIQGVLARPW